MESAVYIVCMQCVYICRIIICVCERLSTSPSPFSSSFSFLWPLTTCNRIDLRDFDHCRSQQLFKQNLSILTKLNIIFH